MDMECCLVAKITCDVDKYLAKCEKLKYQTSKVAGRAIYEGAKVVAAETKSSIQSLPVSANTSGRHGRRNPTQEEKDALLTGLGIARKKVEGDFINVKIGFDGYDGHETDKYPTGHPISMIARSINAGTTFMRKNPFMSRAVRSSKAAAIKAMEEEIDKQVKEIFD